ncbi:hypothetical protein BY458DRAFT_561331 [Sporodiniella umbellata]|nr:hypothetical protein BY458DRAFT_561331 [Sporodiniella umbellata]
MSIESALQLRKTQLDVIFKKELEISRKKRNNYYERIHNDMENIIFKKYNFKPVPNKNNINIVFNEIEDDLGFKRGDLKPIKKSLTPEEKNFIIK